MSLPEHLKTKRDEIAERLANDMVGKIVIKQDAIVELKKWRES